MGQGRTILAAFCFALLSACQGGAGGPEFPPGAKILRMAEVNDVPTLDPAAGYDTVSWEFEQMISRPWCATATPT